MPKLKAETHVFAPLAIDLNVFVARGPGAVEHLDGETHGFDTTVAEVDSGAVVADDHVDLSGTFAAGDGVTLRAAGDRRVKGNGRLDEELAVRGPDGNAWRRKPGWAGARGTVSMFADEEPLIRGIVGARVPAPYMAVGLGDYDDGYRNGEPGCVALCALPGYLGFVGTALVSGFAWHDGARAKDFARLPLAEGFVACLKKQCCLGRSRRC